MKHGGSASGDWQGARLAGIALVFILSTALTPVAVGAPDNPGKPESMPNGGPGPAGNPGSPRAQEERTKEKPKGEQESPAVRTRAHGAPGASNGRKTGASKGRKVRRRGPGTQTTARSNPTPPPQAKAGKTTICHSTGSDTNPYVEITVSNNALPAHGRHHEGGDIIPAPAGGCESTAAASEVRVAASGGVRGARRSEEPERSAGVSSRRTDDRIKARVLGAEASSPQADDAAGTIAEEEDENGESLPFTGLALAGILATGLLALAGGVAARRSVS